MPKTLKASEYSFETELMTTGDFDAGKDNGDTLDSGEVGEIAVAEIGSPDQGSFSSYESVAIGGVPDSQLKSDAGKPFVNLFSGAGNELPDSTQYRFAARDKNSRRSKPLMQWRPLRNADNADPEKRRVLQFSGIDNEDWIHEGRILVVEVRHNSQQITPDFTNGSTTFEVDYVGAF